MKTALQQGYHLAEEYSPRSNLYNLHEILIKKHSHLLDINFLKKLQSNEFHPRRFELYIPELLATNNTLKLECSPNGHGSDWLVEGPENLFFYLEAICPDSLSRPQDFKQVLDKINKSMQKKNAKYNKWVHDKVISSALPYVICIGLYGMDSSYIPLNSLMIQLLNSLKNAFNQTKYSHVSAIIISNTCDQRAMTYGEMKLFNDMILIRNVNATNRLPFNIINVSQEH